MSRTAQPESPAPSAHPPQPLERLVIYGNPAKGELSRVLVGLCDWARRRGVQVAISDDIAGLAGGLDLGSAVQPEFYPAMRVGPGPLRADGRELLVCLGGDGTLLHAARRFWPFNAPVLAVNLGSLSFNATVDVDHVAEAIEEWREGRAPLSPRMVLKVRRLRDGETLNESIVLNDVVLSKQTDSRLIHVTLRQGGELVTGFAADGLIVATPTGSTAYNLSAGGPIVVPTLRLMIVTAICPHTLSARPVILPPDPPVRLQFVPHQGRRQAVVWIDGQEEWPVEPGDQIQVEAEPQPLGLIMRPSFAYFRRLHQKLSWSGDINEPSDKGIEQG